MNKKQILGEELIKNFKSLCGIDLLKEDKIYASNIESALKKKLNKDDEEMSNMVAIFGLFRGQPPFKNFGEITNITSYQELESLFKKWYRDTLLQLLKSDEFLDNEDGAKTYLNAYVQNIKSLGQRAQPFSFKNLEKTFIDIVNNGRWIKDDSFVQRSEFSLENPEDKDLLYEDDQIVIVDGGSRSKCVRYGKGQSWCISQMGQNMFNSYRVNQGATIYFVLQKNVEGNEQKLVILNYNGRYGIADKTNSGNRGGGSGDARSWSEVESEIPNLKGKEKIFKYKPITEEEKKYHQNVSKKYDRDDIIGYIRDSTDGLYLNNTLVTPVDFFSDYVINAVNGKLPDRQFNQIWGRRSDKEVEEMLFKYLSTGIPLNEYQFRIIEKG